MKYCTLHTSNSKLQSGFTLIEVLIAEALIGVVVIALLVTLGNTYKFTSFTDARETAKNLAEYQMQYLKSSSVTFITGATTSSYTLASQPSVYNGYNATTSDVQNLQTNEQLITITVTGHNVTYTLSGYKVNY